jgi:hypothetical protein
MWDRRQRDGSSTYWGSGRGTQQDRIGYGIWIRREIVDIREVVDIPTEGEE